MEGGVRGRWFWNLFHFLFPYPDLIGNKQFSQIKSALPRTVDEEFLCPCPEPRAFLVFRLPKCVWGVMEQLLWAPGVQPWSIHHTCSAHFLPLMANPTENPHRVLGLQEQYQI